MSQAERSAAGLALLEGRMSDAPDCVDRVAHEFEDLVTRPERLPRTLVATGIGTSEGHARHFVEVANRWMNQPARFASTSSLATSPPPGSRDDWLVVFSQGLSANARYALHDLDAWGGILLVTGLPRAGDPERSRLDREKREWLEHLDDAGVVQIELGCGTEYGALVRVIGARVGYAVGWSILRTLATRQLRSARPVEIESALLLDSQRRATAAALEAFPPDAPVHRFFDSNRSLLIVAEGGLLELAHQLSLKVAEGMLRPAPACVDTLQFAHGPLQSHADRPTSILYLADANTDRDWQERLTATLDPQHQDLRVLRASLSAPFSVLEFEAMLDALVLRVVREKDLDLVDWPGRDRESALYEAGPSLAEGLARTGPLGTRPRTLHLEDAVWPEVEAGIAAGRTSALVGLGSTEQHGPHLPMGTDHWIADALLRGLADRLQDAIPLPALAIGCASEHLDFPGTLSIEPTTLESILADLIDSLGRHAFERAFVWTAHGGNVDALNEMRPRLVRRARDLGLALAIETDLDRVAAMQSAAVEAEGLAAIHAGPHAGEYETSLVAALRSGSVRHRSLQAGRVASAAEAQGFFYPSLRANAPNGVVGDPSGASAERGLRYLEAWLDLLEGAYRSAFASEPEKNRQ